MQTAIQLQNLSTVLKHRLTFVATALLFVIWQRVTCLLQSSINTRASSQLLEYRRHTEHIQINEHNKYTTRRRHSQFVFTIRSSIHAVILISFRVSWKAVTFSGAFNVPNNKHLKMTGLNAN